MRPSALLLIIGSITLGLLLTVGTAQAGNAIQAGIDIFSTDPDGTAFALDPIPADFFEPGSEPFDGLVQLCGDSGGAPDTEMQRLDDMSFDEQGQGTVPIEIVALNLVSCEPITVQINGQPTEWDVRVTLPADTPQPSGTMTIQLTEPTGGTFDSSLPVRPLLIFQSHGGDDEVILDPGTTPGTIGDIKGDAPPLYTFEQTGAPWVYEQNGTCPGNTLRIPGTTSNFCAGATPDGPVTIHASSGESTHAYQPTERPPTPTCNGQIATIYVDVTNHIVGGPDAGRLYRGTLRGTSGNDVMVATDGQDRVIGKDGNNTICALADDDLVITGRGNDWIDAGEGENTVIAGAGDDTLRAGSGPDLFICGSGLDTAAPGLGINRLIRCELTP